MFKEEIAKRCESGHETVVSFLIKNKYFDHLDKEEREIVFINSLKNGKLTLILELMNQNYITAYDINDLDPLLFSRNSNFYTSLMTLLRDEDSSKSQC